MVGNAAPPRDPGPGRPTTWGDVFSFIAFIAGCIVLAGAVVVAYAAHLIGYF